MKALSLWQPWASYVALGMKRYETRSWGTDYRGPLAIHAARRELGMTERLLLSRRPLPYGSGEMPFGALVATCELVDCLRMTPAIVGDRPPLELELGDWRVGRFAWVLVNVVRIEPFFAPGSRGLWEWDLPIRT